MSKQTTDGVSQLKRDSLDHSKEKKNNNNKGKQKLDLISLPTVRHIVLREAVKAFYKF